MSRHPSFVSQLLRAYHDDNAARISLPVLPTADQVKYLCEVGLGPIAFRVYGDELKQSDPTLFSVLHSADLTTRVIYGQLERAAAELAGVLQDVGVVPTFLKGISTSYEFYAPPHLRVMGDIDILIERSEVELVMTKVADLGYEITEKQWRWYRKHEDPHLPAAFNPKTGVTIEVHTGLIGAADFYAGEPVFQSDIFTAHKVEFEYEGTRVARFTPQYQFIYTVSKWSADAGWAENLTNINDVIHILKKYESEFDWPTLSRWISASPYLIPITVALLHFLEQADIITVSPRLRDALFGADHKLGPKRLKMLTWLLNTYPFNVRNKNYGGYSRWRANALWLYLSKPKISDSEIPIAILRALLRSLRYGRYNPIYFVPLRLKALFYWIKEKRVPT